MNAFDDITLIQKFVHSEIGLLANHNLRLEPGIDTAQLLTRKGGIIATINLASKIRSVLLRQTQYSDLVSQILVENHFIPMGLDRQGQMRYEQHPIPANYEINYTEARVLWKTWWTQKRQSRSAQNSPYLLIFRANGWQALQNLTFSQENLFLQTVIDEVMLAGSDRLVWLSPIKATEPATQIFNYRPQTPTTPPPLPTPSSCPTTVPDAAPCNAVRFHRGRLYVQTIAGEVIVEGANLKFWVKPTAVPVLDRKKPLANALARH
jgi:hypothetical protein